MNTFTKVSVLAAILTMSQSQISHAGSHTWTGAGSNKYWNNAANWSGGAPTAVEAAPVTLLFTNGVVSTNNIPGLIVDSLVLKAGDCVMHGSAGGTLAFRGTGGTNLISYAFYGASNAIASTLPVTLNGTNVFSIVTGNTMNIQSAISGSGTLTLLGSGDLYFTGTQPNTYTGQTTLLRCGLHLGKTPGVSAIAGPLVVGDDDVILNSESVYLEAANQISLSASVTINTNAQFYCNGFNQTLGQLNLAGGDIVTGGGVLTLSTNVTIYNGGVASQIDGLLSLGGATRSFNFAGPGTLVIGAVISDGGASAGITKNGPGELILKGPNTYTGLTLINSGSLRVESNQAFGSTAAGLVIATNASIWFEGVSIGAESLMLGGTVTSTGSNYWSGNVVLLNDVIIDVSAGSQFNFGGPISGSGALIKNNVGDLILSGGLANSYTGGTFVNAGTLKLNKTGAVAIPGPLIVGDGYGGTNVDIVSLLQPNQIADSAAVTVSASGLLDMSYLFGASDTFGSLIGTGNLFLGLNNLTVGGNNATTTFSGVITGFGASSLFKQGSGELFLNGNSPNFLGSIIVSSGTLSVNGSMAGSPVTVNSGGTLSGNGFTGPVSCNNGKLSPGNSTGTLQSGNLSLNAFASFEPELKGTTPGSGYDQLVVTGSISLGGAFFHPSLGFGSVPGNKFVIVSNDSNDAIVGTFSGLPEGATLVIGGAQFQISYKGGDGNDVELTQLSAITPSQIGSIVKLANGQIQINGSGLANANYDIEANANLNTTNWLKVGTAQSDMNGAITFTDLNAPNFPARFYRFKTQ